MILWRHNESISLKCMTGWRIKYYQIIWWRHLWTTPFDSYIYISSTLVNYLSILFKIIILYCSRTYFQIHFLHIRIIMISGTRSRHESSFVEIKFETAITTFGQEVSKIGERPTWGRHHRVVQLRWGRQSYRRQRGRR